jgi:hypothetical protein
MFSSIRRHLSYANVVATMALVFAMGGSAIAAKHYLINSTKQINPKVLKKLQGNRGNTGKTGATGLQGTPGGAGAAGAPGAPGANGAVAGYSASEIGPSIDITNSEKTIVSKTLPAGHYIVSAKVLTIALSEGNTGAVETECELNHEGEILDYSQATATLPVLATEYTGAATLALDVALNTTKSTTLSVVCETNANTTPLTHKVLAVEGRLQAVQTSTNS